MARRKGGEPAPTIRPCPTASVPHCAGHGLRSPRFPSRGPHYWPDAAAAPEGDTLAPTGRPHSRWGESGRRPAVPPSSNRLSPARKATTDPLVTTSFRSLRSGPRREAVWGEADRSAQGRLAPPVVPAPLPTRADTHPGKAFGGSRGLAPVPTRRARGAPRRRRGVGPSAGGRVEGASRRRLPIRPPPRTLRAAPDRRRSPFAHFRGPLLRHLHTAGVCNRPKSGTH